MAREGEGRWFDMHITHKHCCMQWIVSDFMFLKVFHPMSRLVTTKMCDG